MMKKNKGFTLLVSIVVTSIMLIVSFVVVNVALKQVILAQAGVESQYAFYNADSGVDCAIYWDLKNGNNGISPFATSTGGTISCGSVASITSGSQTVSTVPTQLSVVGGGGSSNPTSIFQVDFVKGCAIVRVTKLNNGDTTVESRGYNTCSALAVRRYERGVTITYSGNENTIQGSTGNSGSLGHIVLSPSSFTFSANTGVAPSVQQMTIQNTGPGSINWSTSQNQSWCHTSTGSGTLGVGSINLNIVVDAIGSAGTYNCTVTVDAPDADNAPQTVAVTDNVSSVSGFTVDTGGTLTTNLISYWKLNEASGTRVDSKSSYNLTSVNGVTSAAGKISNAGSFSSASSQYLTKTDNPDLSTGSTNFTISAWVNINDDVTRVIASKFTPSDPSGLPKEWRLIYQASTKQFSFSTTDSGGVVTSINAATPTPITLGSWYFVVAWRNQSAGTINIQVNNGTVYSVAAGAPLDTTAPFNIGQSHSTVYWNGKIDEVGFWKKVLTAQERTDLYNGGTGNTYNP